MPFLRSALRLAAICVSAAFLSARPALALETPGLECFSTNETREKIASAKLAQPLILIRRAAGDMHADAVNSRLCRWNNELVYEISLLRRDGHIVRLLMDATNGKAVDARR
ncbi:MAG: hypothetical protein NVSMB26_28040 [Beijerinckiaceae bacterium]